MTDNTYKPLSPITPTTKLKNLVVRAKHTITEALADPVRYAFLGVNRENAELNLTKEKQRTRQMTINEEACLAIVSVKDNQEKQLDIFNIDVVELLPYNPELISKSILLYKLKEIYIDPENYDWLVYDYDRAVNNIFITEPKRRGKLPILVQFERDKSTIIRQRSILQPLVNTGRLTKSRRIEQNPAILSALDLIGQSTVPDALAGAIEAATFQIELIRVNRKVMSEEKMVWNGMTRQCIQPPDKPDSKIK